MKKKLLLSMCLLLTPVSAMATTIFADDFSSGSLGAWTFHGNNAGDWSISSEELNHNAPSGYTGHPEFALMDGVVTPDRFTLEADVRVNTGIHGNDWGHVGFVWGVNDLTGSFDSFNTSYLRTHQDRVTNWSKLDGNNQGEQFLNVPGATNDTTYHLKIDVDYLTRTMMTSMAGYSTSFSGLDFDRINQNSGGGIGLISWGDNISYDNVVLSSPATAVPEPATMLLFGTGLVGLVGMRKKIAKA